MAKKKKLPLYRHRNGQWAKTIRGRKYYFGTDYASALKRYLAEKDHIGAGVTVPTVPASDLLTLADLANLYLAWMKERVVAGELSTRTRSEAISTLKRLAAFRGRDDYPAHWSPQDFADIKEELFRPVARTKAIRGGIKGPSVARRASTTVDGDIRRITAWLNWCSKSEYIPSPRYGASFQQTPARQLRIRRADAGPRNLEAAEIRKILGASSARFRPILLLACNSGMGAADIAQLRVQPDGEWLDCPRQKNGVPRRIWLWPETIIAIAGIAGRSNDDNLLFRTAQGLPWVRGSTDAISQRFKAIREAAGVPRGTFYDLRRTFQTVAEETLDFPAVSHVMGHIAGSGDMSARYRQRISDDRIRRVCEHVRSWLLET